MIRPLTIFNRNRNLPSAATDAGDPFLRLQSEMNRLFEDAFAGFPAVTEFARAGVAPRLDLRETEEALEAEIELPGVTDKDIDVSIVDNVLTVRGEKRAERKEDDEGRGYHLVERSYGSFARAIPLPVEVDPERVDGVFKDGVLRLTLPKLPQSKSRTRKIEIRRG
jgi:HSP20 family protein